MTNEPSGKGRKHRTEDEKSLSLEGGSAVWGERSAAEQKKRQEHGEHFTRTLGASIDTREGMPMNVNVDEGIYERSRLLRKRKMSLYTPASLILARGLEEKSAKKKRKKDS